MTTLFTKATLALALGATALTAAAPADAQRYGGRGHSDHTGTAIIAGIAGLAIGAALVAGSNSHRDRGYAYDDGRGYGYDDRVDYRREGYDRQGYGDYRQGYDNYGYQGQRGYAPSCHIESRWDGYARRQVAVRVCD